MEKEFKTIDEQIEILKARNMRLDDYYKAYSILEKNNYYYLINGYKDLFLDKSNKKERFIDNVNIDEIYSLYNFDKNIKINFLKYLLHIENEINTYIAYEFSKNYGHKNYLVLENFNNSNLNTPQIQKFINDINLEIQYQYRSSNKMIVHYLDNYNHIPLWVLVRILSFGKISKFYSFMKDKDKNMISRKYDLGINEFRILLHNLTLIRNICAHDEKLYDIKMKSRMASTVYHKKMKIPMKNGNYQFGTRDLFSIVIILKMLLNKKDFEVFYKIIIENIQNLEKSISSIRIEKILAKMGFPQNYKKLKKL